MNQGIEVIIKNHATPLSRADQLRALIPAQEHALRTLPEDEDYLAKRMNENLTRLRLEYFELTGEVYT